MSEKEEYLDIREHLDLVAEWCEKHDGEVLENTASKTIGTYYEDSLREFIQSELGLESKGSIAKGIDLPHFNIDVKTTRITGPQSSSKIRNFSERLTGPPYNILLIVYSKEPVEGGERVDFENVVYVPQEYTSDHRFSGKAREEIEKYKQGDLERNQLKKELEDLISENEGDVTEIKEDELDDLIENPPHEGIITISPAVQWRFSYNKLKETPIPEEADLVYNKSKSRQDSLVDLSE